MDALGTLALGTTVRIGLRMKVKSRTGSTTALPPFREYVDAATPTAGIIDGTNNTYIPNAVANGARKYCVYYEFDATDVVDPKF